jgi:hypothetical protein
MTAVAPLLNLPPVTTLTLVRDDVAEALARAEALVAANRHGEAVAELDELWLSVRSDQALALRQRLALSWSEMTLGNLEHAAGLLEQADGIVRAPRFDASGKKIEPARFQRVLFNGQLVQKEVDVPGPTRAHRAIDEAAVNPLMLQGDHGPVAFRNIYTRPLRPLIVR